MFFFSSCCCSLWHQMVEHCWLLLLLLLKPNDFRGKKNEVERAKVTLLNAADVSNIIHWSLLFKWIPNKFEHNTCQSNFSPTNLVIDIECSHFGLSLKQILFLISFLTLVVPSCTSIFGIYLYFGDWASERVNEWVSECGV